VAWQCASCGVRETLVPGAGLCFSCFTWASGSRLQSPDPEVFFHLLVAIIARAKADCGCNSEVPLICACGRITVACASEFVQTVIDALDGGDEPWIVVEAVGKMTHDAALDAGGTLGADPHPRPETVAAASPGALPLHALR